MNVCCEYYDVGCSKPVVRPIILLDLAKHVATEWMPGVPNPVIDGLAGVLYGVLEPCQIGYRNNYWCVNPNLARTDRQWRGATSWILGVAFARFAMECEGYRWWAPLSAFGGPKSTGKTDTGCWVGPKVEYSIRKKSSSSARYLPDYVVCRAEWATAWRRIRLRREQGHRLQHCHMACAPYRVVGPGQKRRTSVSTTRGARGQASGSGDTGQSRSCHSRVPAKWWYACGIPMKERNWMAARCLPLSWPSTMPPCAGD